MPKAMWFEILYDHCVDCYEVELKNDLVVVHDGVVCNDCFVAFMEAGWIRQRR